MGVATFPPPPDAPAVGSVVPASFGATAIDPPVGTPGARTLGTGTQQAAPGNDARFPTSSGGTTLNQIDPTSAPYNAKADLTRGIDGVISAVGSNTFSSTSTLFTLLDVGKLIAISGAGSYNGVRGYLVARIASIVGGSTGHSITFSGPGAAFSVSNAPFDFCTDNQTALATATAAARTGGIPVYLRSGILGHSSQIDFTGVAVQGEGTASELRAVASETGAGGLTTSFDARILIGGTGVNHRRYAASAPYVATDVATKNGAAFYITATEFNLDTLRVLSSASVGFLFDGAQRGDATGCYATDTLADGFCVTGGSADVTGTNCYSYRSGGNCFAVSSDLQDAAPCDGVDWVGCKAGQATRSTGRGFKFSGGINLSASGCRARSTGGAGFAVVSQDAQSTAVATGAMAANNPLLTMSAPTFALGDMGSRIRLIGAGLPTLREFGFSLGHLRDKSPSFITNFCATVRAIAGPGAYVRSDWEITQTANGDYTLSTAAITALDALMVTLSRFGLRYLPNYHYPSTDQTGVPFVDSTVRVDGNGTMTRLKAGVKALLDEYGPGGNWFTARGGTGFPVLRVEAWNEPNSIGRCQWSTIGAARLIIEGGTAQPQTGSGLVNLGTTPIGTLDILVTGLDTNGDGVVDQQVMVEGAYTQTGQAGPAGITWPTLTDKPARYWVYRIQRDIYDACKEWAAAHTTQVAAAGAATIEVQALGIGNIDVFYMYQLAEYARSQGRDIGTLFDLFGYHPYSSYAPTASGGSWYRNGAKGRPTGGTTQPNHIDTTTDLRALLDNYSGRGKPLYASEMGTSGDDASNKYNGGPSNVDFETVAAASGTSGSVSQETNMPATFDHIVAQNTAVGWLIQGLSPYRLHRDRLAGTENTTDLYNSGLGLVDVGLRATLTASMTNVQATMQLSGIVGTPPAFPYHVWVGAERIRVNSLASGSTYNVTRAQSVILDGVTYASTAAAHSAGDFVYTDTSTYSQEPSAVAWAGRVRSPTVTASADLIATIASFPSPPALGALTDRATLSASPTSGISGAVVKYGRGIAALGTQPTRHVTVTDCHTADATTGGVSGLPYIAHEGAFHVQAYSAAQFVQDVLIDSFTALDSNYKGIYLALPYGGGTPAAQNYLDNIRIRNGVIDTTPTDVDDTGTAYGYGAHLNYGNNIELSDVVFRNTGIKAVGVGANISGVIRLARNLAVNPGLLDPAADRIYEFSASIDPTIAKIVVEELEHQNPANAIVANNVWMRTNGAVVRESYSAAGTADSLGTGTSWWVWIIDQRLALVHGTPDGVITAAPGAIALRDDTASDGTTALYVKASGTGSVGWIPLGPAGGGIDTTPFDRFFELRRAADAVTGNLFIADNNFAPTDGTIYYAAGWTKLGGTYTRVRIYVPTAFTFGAGGDFRVGVWNTAGTSRLAETANESVAAGSAGEVILNLDVPVTLGANTKFFGGIGTFSRTAGAYRSKNIALNAGTNPTGGPRVAQTGTGYAGGALPAGAIGTSTAQQVPVIELLP